MHSTYTLLVFTGARSRSSSAHESSCSLSLLIGLDTAAGTIVSPYCQSKPVRREWGQGCVNGYTKAAWKRANTSAPIAKGTLLKKQYCRYCSFLPRVAFYHSALSGTNHRQTCICKEGSMLYSALPGHTAVLY